MHVLIKNQIKNHLKNTVFKYKLLWLTLDIHVNTQSIWEDTYVTLCYIFLSFLIKERNNHFKIDFP